MDVEEVFIAENDEGGAVKPNHTDEWCLVARVGDAK